MAAPWDNHIPWEATPDPDFEEDEGADIEQLSADECAGVFADYLIQLKSEGVLSAKQACLLAYWANRAGVQGEAAKLAMGPEKEHWELQPALGHCTVDTGGGRALHEARSSHVTQGRLLPCAREHPSVSSFCWPERGVHILPGARGTVSDRRCKQSLSPRVFHPSGGENRG